MSKKELLLNTLGSCFLCLQDTSSSVSNKNGITSSGDNYVTEVSLRSICRYLQIDPSSVLLKSLAGNVEENEEETATENILYSAGGTLPCDFSVMLCGKCNGVVAKLSSLIRELEVAQMLVNHHLQSLDKILNGDVDGGVEGQKVNTCRDHVRDKLSGKTDNQMDQTEVRIVEVLREETKIKCSKSVKAISSSSPRVHLSRSDENLKRANSSTSAPFSDDSDTTSSENSNFEEPMTLDLEDTQPCSYPTEGQSLQSNTLLLSFPPVPVIDNTCINSEPLPGRVLPRRPPPPQQKHSCPFCSSYFLQPGRWEEHQVLYHTDQLFSVNEIRQANVTPEQFKTCCANLVLTEIEACRRTEHLKNHPITHCSYCCASFTNVQKLQVHMCTRHLPVLEEKLVALQQQQFPSVTSHVKVESILPN